MREKTKLGVDRKKTAAKRTASAKRKTRAKSRSGSARKTRSRTATDPDTGFARARSRLDKTKGKRHRDRHWAFYWNMCPKCGGDMFEQEVQEIRFEVCRTCKSIHFDQAELALVAKYRDAKKFLKAAVLKSKKPDTTRR